MKNNGEGKFLVMCAADENKKAAENKIYKLSGFREQKLFYIFYFDGGNGWKTKIF